MERRRRRGFEDVEAPKKRWSCFELSLGCLAFVGVIFAAGLYAWKHGVEAFAQGAVKAGVESSMAVMDPDDDARLTAAAKEVMKRRADERAQSRYSTPRSDKDLEDELRFWKKRIKIEWTLDRRAFALARARGYPDPTIMRTWDELESDGFWMNADPDYGRSVSDEEIVHILDRHAGSRDMKKRIDSLGK